MSGYADLYNRLIEEHKGRPKISVVMPYYNLGKYVQASVSSIEKAQGNLPAGSVELVIVNDASPEPLPELTLPPGVKQRIITNASNQYLAETLNTGIREARGHYILPLDPDNMLAPNALETLSHALDFDRGLDISYGKMAYYPEGRPEEMKISGWPPAEANPARQLAHQNQISSTAMYRRKVWKNTGGYRRRCHTAEDADFWSRALSIGFRARRVTEAVTFVYCDRGDSMSRTQKDWPWHRWYSYANEPKLRLFGAGGKSIPTHEFPLVSVVIPVGPGHERLVLDALDSVQNQTFPYWEAVVVNDTGAPLPWLPSWARATVTTKNGLTQTGVATARNIGLWSAKGRYVLFLDADDWLHTEALGRMYEMLQTRGGFVYGDWFKGESGEINEAPEFDPDDVLRRLPYPVTCMYDREALIEKDIKFDTNFNHKGWEDWDFQLQAVAKHGLCGTRIPVPLFHYRYTTGTLREKAFARKDEMKAAVYEKWQDYITGKADNVAKCGGCGGVGRPPELSKAGVLPPTTQASPDEGETVELEYIGDDSGKRSFLGRVTGNRYKFSTDDAEHRIRRVFVQDAPALLSMGMFRKRAASELGGRFEALQAAGPPVR